MIPDVSKDRVAIIFSVPSKIKATELLEISITLKKKDTVIVRNVGNRYPKKQKN